MDLGPGDEIVTSDSEHPGLIGPLVAARAPRRRRCARCRSRESPTRSRATTTLVACSHVNWITGEVAPAALAERRVPVVLDGAQGAGAVPLDVRALGCAAYAAAGQKWLCGADGTGMLYVAPEFARARAHRSRPRYLGASRTPRAGWTSTLRADGRRFDTPSLPREGRRVLARRARAARAAGPRRRATPAPPRSPPGSPTRSPSAGHTVAPRGDSTLVAWEDPDPPATRERLADAGVVVRDLPGTPYLRASVGAWNDESDLERLLARS